MRKLLLFYIFLFIALWGWSTDYHRKVVWKQAVSSEKTGMPALGSLFEGAVITGENNLPYWVESFELQASAADIVITNTVFETFSDSTKILNDLLSEELQYSIVPGTSAGKYHTRVSVLPFVKRNGQVQRLMEFTLVINEKAPMLKSAKALYDWKQSSVLKSGKWNKIKVKDKGIYKITYDQLKSWGYTNPESVVLYGNGGYMLPLLNKDLKADDLLPYPVWKGKDNANKDALFFYATGNIQLNYDLQTATLSHQQNYYSTETYFFLSDQGTPLVIQKAPEVPDMSGRQINTFPNYALYEKEEANVIQSGSEWYGKQFFMGESHSININLDNPDLSIPASVMLSAAGGSSDANSMDLTMNGRLVMNIPFSLKSDYDFARKGVKTAMQTLPGKTLPLKLTYNARNNVSTGWLDYVAVNYMSMLSMTGDVTSFRGIGADGVVQVSEFVVSGATSGTKILNITDIHQTVEMPATYLNAQLRFKSNSPLINEYVAFNSSGNIPSPEFAGEVANQNLHGGEMADMIIVTNAAFLTEANELADIHRNADQMIVLVITPDLIFNEFSGGLPDPAGIRNYFRMYYDRGKQSGGKALKYVLLLGDGSYDNRNILGENLNLLPTFQSENSLSETGSFVTDDFFV
ncbi:MAG: hypothetical protein H7X84_00475, partial [Verrucomicrobia bacterium]|nr:hypothetical protein [Prolixibacteraceae bacterium]